MKGEIEGGRGVLGKFQATFFFLRDSADVYGILEGVFLSLDIYYRSCIEGDRVSVYDCSCK